MQVVWEYRFLLLEGTWATIQLAIASVLLAVFLGLIGAWAKLSGSQLLLRLANIYTTLIRGAPDLVIMLLLFYGGQQLLNDLGLWTGWWDYLELDQFAAGVLAIGFVFGAYMTETFRGAYMSIQRGQIEAAMACGMNQWVTFRLVIWPNLVRLALPSFSNNWLVLLKTTALVSVIGLHDVVWNAASAGRAVREPFTFMFTVLIIFLLLTASSNAFLRWLERKYAVAGA